MRAFLLVVSLATAVIARPDIGLQLREKSLATSYGVPSASVTNLNEHSFLPPSASFQTPFLSTSVPFYSGAVTTEAPVFQSTVASTPAPYYGSSEISSTPAPYYGAPSVSTTVTPFISTTPSPLYGSPFLGNGIGSSSEGLFYNQDASLFGGSQLSSLQSSHFVNPQPEVVQKHVYFYEAPEEPEVVTQSPIPVEPPKKNVKIIFIKAPQYTAPVYPQIPAQPQNQEKTIVYVLVKKPEEQQQIVVPTQPPTPPAKPEVYFIKYKNQQEAELKVSNTLNEHSNSGANIITNGIDTASLAPNGLRPYISSTELPLGLGVGGSFLSTSTLSPLLGDNSYSYSIGSDLSIGNQGLEGQFVTSTEPTIVSNTPYKFAPIHPTYGLPNKK